MTDMIRRHKVLAGVLVGLAVLAIAWWVLLTGDTSVGGHLQR